MMILQQGKAPNFYVTGGNKNGISKPFRMEQAGQGTEKRSLRNSVRSIWQVYIFSREGCKELKSMTWKQMQEVVANCEDFCKVYNRTSYFYITITGGDPILHPDFWKLMELLKSKNIPFTLMENMLLQATELGSAGICYCRSKRSPTGP